MPTTCGSSSQNNTEVGMSRIEGTDFNEKMTTPWIHRLRALHLHPGNMVVRPFSAFAERASVRLSFNE